MRRSLRACFLMVRLYQLLPQHDTTELSLSLLGLIRDTVDKLLSSAPPPPPVIAEPEASEQAAGM